MRSIMDRMKKKYDYWVWKKYISKARKREVRSKNQNVISFDPALFSDNMGDYIIQCYCKKVLMEIFEKNYIKAIPTHKLPDSQEINLIAGAKTKIVCGTNLMTPHYEEYSNWKMPTDLYGYSDIITLGVGWGYYCDDISKYSKLVYKTILSDSMLHSVRDNYTLGKFKEMGIENVINTGCPTMWGLNKQHCRLIPIHKSKRVITTLTDYDRDVELDKRMINVLLENFDKVYVWLQGLNDFEYLEKIANIDVLNIVPRNIEAYTKILDEGDIDYVGTRLHAGIHALNRKVRSLILAVDNRATEMGHDFNLPVVQRSISSEQLKKLIMEDCETKVIIDEKAIDKWKAQFQR